MTAQYERTSGSNDIQRSTRGRTVDAAAESLLQDLKEEDISEDQDAKAYEENDTLRECENFAHYKSFEYL